MSDMLVTKYNPNNLDEIVGRNKLIESIKTSVRTKKEIPHLLFEGFQGSGKTTLAHAIRNELYGHTANNGWWFELNASNNNGVDFIRETVTNWAMLSIPDTSRSHKVIFLDEADYLTVNAQAVLRRVMEDYAKTCRFILSCNFKEKLIDPLLSRCQIYNFAPIDEKYIFAYIKWICTEEKFKADEKKLQIIAKLGKGDMRQTLNCLEQYMMGKDTVIFEEELLKKDLKALIDLTYTNDCDLLMSKLHQELVSYAIALPKYDLSEAFIVLSDYDLKCSMSKLKTLQVQSAFIHIKQLFAKAKAAVK